MLKFKPLNITEEDIRNQQDPEVLRDWQEAMLIELAEVKTRVASMKARATEGNYAPPRYYNSQQTLQRAIGLMIEIVKRQLSKFNSANPKRHINHYFVEAARAVLSPEVFQQINQQAEKNFNE